MPDTAQDSSPQPSPAIADLAPPADDKSVSGLVSSLTALDRKKVADDTRITRESDEQQRRDREVSNHAFQMEGVAASEIPKPWDAEKEHKKWETDPLQGFGSAGGLFAMVASAFTKAPMENAINGMAGAINSIKEGNEAGYARAYDAFKTNVKLAEQRFKTQHELYSDALSLGQADAAASAAKLHNAAVRFGDSQMLMLAEHGMIKEIYELQAARASANEQMIKAADALDLHTIQKGAVDAIKKNPPSTGDPVQDKMMLAAQIQRIYDGGGKYGSAEQEAVGRFMQTSMNKSAQEIADGLAGIHQQFSAKAPNIEGYQTAKTAWAEQHPGETMPTDEDAKLLQQFGLTVGPRGTGGSGAGKTLTNDRTINADAEEHKARMKKEHPDWDETKLDSDRDAYVKQRKAATATPSGNRVDDLQGKIDQTDNIIRESNANLDFLHQFKGGAGLMGKIMRGEEIGSNIVGAGTQTERVAFRRRVHELQEMVPRIITDSNGRPLKAAQDKVDDFVAGLSAGDTGPNTIRAYEDLIVEMQKRQGDYRKRKTGSESAATGAPEPAGNSDWLNAYPEKH
jgi:hypothetical protein